MRYTTKTIFILLTSWMICFGQQGFVWNVPDHSQPPYRILPSTFDSTNYCAPCAFVNIIDYWENVQSHPYAQGIMGGLPAKEVTEYIGWFMDTNDHGSQDRRNGNINYPNFPSSVGTYNNDQADGMYEYCDFDVWNPYGFPFPIPVNKEGYPWEIIPHFIGDFPIYTGEIDMGFPVKLDFQHWHILPTGNYIIDPVFADDTVFIYTWGTIIDSSGFDPDAPEERWNLEQGEGGIGHAVTGVGYIIDTLEFAIVHDNWSNTPRNIAIPWQDFTSPFPNVTSMIFVYPREDPDLTVTNIQTAIDTAIGFIDTLNFGQPITIINTIKNLTTNNIPSFNLVTQIFDPMWINIADDTLVYTSPSIPSTMDSIILYFDSLFIPQQFGTFNIISQVFWDENGDSLIYDPPDADPTNDVMSIQRFTNYNIIYSRFKLIPNVPDVNQPPAATLPSTIPDNFCAPISAVNITEYWDVVMNHSNAVGVNASFSSDTAAEYIGWFMDTNDHPMGNPYANNGTPGYPSMPGTYAVDQDTFLYYYVRWDTTYPYHASTPAMPAAKKGYDWIFNSDYNTTTNIGFPFYQSEIDNDRPAKIDFMHWNIFFTGNLVIDSVTLDTVYLYDWGNPVYNSQAVDSAAPIENWNLENGFTGIGHAVTGVGYLYYGQPDSFYAIVHDNWSITPGNIAVPWFYWNATMAMDPGSSVVKMDEDFITIEKFKLFQNYPNPFNPNTTIEFSIPKSEFVTLKIYNTLGQEVAILVSEQLSRGNYKYTWDASEFASGIYYYKINAGSFVKTKKLLIIK